MTHLIHDTPLYLNADTMQAVVEIPAGTLEKWHTPIETGHLVQEFRNNRPRCIHFLPYPFNYGFLPQTFLSEEDGGDQDPLDIAILSARRDRGTIVPVRILGAFHIQQYAETDTKLIALDLEQNPFNDVQTLGGLFLQHPGAVEIVRLWFESYKPPGEVRFLGYVDADEAQALIAKAHTAWQAYRSKL